MKIGRLTIDDWSNSKLGGHNTCKSNFGFCLWQVLNLCLLIDCHVSQAWGSEVKKRRGGWRQFLLYPMELNRGIKSVNRLEELFYVPSQR